MLSQEGVLGSYIGGTSGNLNRRFRTATEGPLFPRRLSVASAGTLFTVPKIGLLDALGIALAQNFGQEPVVTSLARAIRPNAFHIWGL